MPRPGPLYPVPGTVAASLLDEVSLAPDVRLVAGVSGPGGSGKSALLDHLGARYRAAGLRVHRELPTRAGPGRAAVLIDDAHQLGAPVLSQLAGLLDRSELDLVVAYRLWPQRPELRRLARALEERHSPIVLGPFSRQEIAAHADAAAGVPVPASIVEAIRDLTGGLPWLVQRVLSAVAGNRLAPDALASPELVDQLGNELDGLDADLHELLLALALGFDLSGALPPSLERAASIDDLVEHARSAGLLLADETVPPLLRDAVLRTTPAHHVRALQRTLVQTYVAEGRELDPIAPRLARAGLRDPRIAAALVRAADHALTTDPEAASRLYADAVSAGAGETETAARRAQAAWATGNSDTAGRILEDVLTDEAAPDVTRGVDTAGALWAQRGMLARGAEGYRWLGPGRVGASAPLAVVAMIGSGDPDGAAAMAAVPIPTRSPALPQVAATLMAQGVLATVQGTGAAALPALVRASDLMTASGQTVPLPELPGVLAALVALHGGELGVAESVLGAALAGGQGGPRARPRLQLLRAWALMQSDRADRAHAAVAEATAAPGGVSARDELLLRALDVGLARRTDDVPALVRNWQRVRESVLHLPVDLYSLLPLGELVVVAARLRDSGRLESQLEEAWGLLDRLGNPPLWSVPLHWSAVQAAILAERPGDIAPHAAALVRAAERSRPAAALATAGRAWMSVLSGAFDAGAVEKAARGLATVGLTWDGSRLAGHAAVHAEERRDMARLLACARDLHAGPGAGPSAAPESPPGGPRTRGEGRPDTALSAREREVARLVLDGKNYREIGEAIFISPRTVEHHIARIRHRLDATTRSDLLAQLRIALEADDQD